MPPWVWWPLVLLAALVVLVECYQWWSRREAAEAGQCRTCGASLPDDNELGYCSEDCWAVDRL